MAEENAKSSKSAEENAQPRSITQSAEEKAQNAEENAQSAEENAQSAEESAKTESKNRN